MRLSSLTLAMSSVVFGQTYTISTFAGGGSPDGAPATSLALNVAQGVASDPAGNIFIATSDSVFRLDAVTGTMTKISATGASAIAADGFGNVYVAVAQGTHVQKISNGVVTTVAGNGVRGVLGDNGPATGAWFSTISGLAVDSSGNLFISDSGTHRVRMVSHGIITTIAGSSVCVSHSMSGFILVTCPSGFSGDGGSATSALLDSPARLAVDAGDNLYIVDRGNSRIREVSGGVITTIAGGGTETGEGVRATSANLSPGAVAVDSAGQVYVSESANVRVRVIAGGIITTVVGTGTPGFSGDNGPALAAQLNRISGLALDPAGHLYIADDVRVRKVSAGIIATVAGSGERTFSGDGGAATGAVLLNPLGVAVDAAGNVYVSDSSNHRVRKVSNGVITTIAGNGIQGFTGDGGSAINAKLNTPAGLAVDSTGNLYILDVGNHRIREVSNGVISTIAGNGVADFSADNTPATSAAISAQGIAVNPAGVLYFSESLSTSTQSSIRTISNGLLMTVPGTVAAGPFGATPVLDHPTAIAFDAAGNLYVVEQGRVREIANGVLTTVVGNGGFIFNGDGGPATNASGSFGNLAIDSVGNLYLSDVVVINSLPIMRIRKVSNGIINTIAGNGTNGFSGDNGPALNAQMSSVGGLAADSVGNVYVADSGNNRIRVLAPVLGPDLTISNIHNGNFTAGQVRATYTIIVGNGGTGPTIGTVSVTEMPPAFAILVLAMTGSGWNCLQPAGPCTRADPLSPSSFYPPITVTVNVTIQSPIVGVTNQATVAGGGETYTQNDTALDTVIVPQGAPLITSVSPNPAPGLTGMQTVFVDGIGFGGLAKVRITGPNGQTDLPYAPPVTLFSDAQLSVAFDLGATTSNWTVQVIRSDGQASNIFPFAVSPPVTTSFALPQLVFGGAWYTALYFSNTTQTVATITVNFIGNDGAALNVPLAGIGTVPAYTFSVAPRSTVILEALNNTGTPGEGWVETSLPTGLIGYAVFRQAVVGRADQEAVVPLTPESSQIADLTYDDIDFTTSVAFLNPTNQPAAVTITAYNADGSLAGSSQVPLAPRFKVATVLKTLPGLDGIAGKRGRLVFSVTNGEVSVLGLRFGGSAFTSIPVLHRPAVAPTNTTTLALPQFVFGDAWYTALYLSNTTNAAVSVPVTFLDDSGALLNAPLKGIGPAPFRMVTLNPGATEILEAPNGGSPGEGWVEVTLPPGVTGYGVFRQVIVGRENQEAVVPLTVESNLNADLIYDDVQFTTSVAFLNANQFTTVTITAYSANGAQVGSTQLTLQGRAKFAKILKTLPGLEGMAGNRGWVTFSVPSGAVSVLGLRFGGEAFTSIPVTSR